MNAQIMQSLNDSRQRNAERLRLESMGVARNAHRKAYTKQCAREIVKAARADGMRGTAWMRKQLVRHNYNAFEAWLATGVGNYTQWYEARRAMPRPFVVEVV